MNEREEIELIKRLKYRYIRAADTKQWEDFKNCFTADARSSYAGGKHAYEGAEQISEFAKFALGRNSMLTMHHVHHPEIDLIDENHAKGVWAFEDWVQDMDNNIRYHGAGYYNDEYTKIEGAWRIQSTGYERLFEEVYSFPEGMVVETSSTLFPGKSVQKFSSLFTREE